MTREQRREFRRDIRDRKRHRPVQQHHKESAMSSIRVIRPEDGAVIFDDRTHEIREVDRPKGEPDHGDLIYLRVNPKDTREPIILAFPPEWVLGLTHTHVYEASQDCDGPHFSDHVERGGIDRTVSGLDLFLTSEGHGTFDKTVDELGFYTVEIHAPTDEGYHAITFRECQSNSCNLDERNQRDVYAEQAGY